VAWHPNSAQEGATIATSSFDATAAVWNRGQGESTWEVCAQLEGHENEVKGVAWSTDGKYLATSSRDKSVWIWESEGGGEEQDYDAEFEYDCSAVLTGHTQDVKCVRFHPSSSKHLFSASYDDTVRLWKFDEACEDWIESYQISGVHTSTVWSLDFDPSGQFMCTCSDDLSIAFFRVTSP